jgi:type II secretory pathway component PulF
MIEGGRETSRRGCLPQFAQFLMAAGPALGPWIVAIAFLALSAVLAYLLIMERPVPSELTNFVFLLLGGVGGYTIARGRRGR